MDVSSWIYFVTLLFSVTSGTWRNSEEGRALYINRSLHSHTKRHMTQEPNKRLATPKPSKLRKKPSGHLKPLEEDDIENDEIISVAVGPPPLRPKYDKVQSRRISKQNQTTQSNVNLVTSTSIVKEILLQLGREFLTHQVSEDFAFGQYVGTSMKNLTSELRVKMQHEILELIMKYQKINRGEMKLESKTESPNSSILPTIRDLKMDNRIMMSDDNLLDFKHLEKIV